MFDNSSMPVTGAAQELIDQYADSQRMRLVREIDRLKDRERAATGRVDIEEVTRAINRLESRPLGLIRVGDSPSGRRLIVRLAYIAINDPRTFKMIAALVSLAFVMFLSAAGLLWLTIAQNSELNALAVILGIFAGVLSGFVGFWTRSYLIKRKAKSRLAKRSATVDFARKVDDIEKIARGAAFTYLGRSLANASLGEVLSFLVDSKIWSEKDLSDYRQLLRIRNSVVHQEKFVVPSVDLLALTESVNRLEGYLRERLRDSVKKTQDSSSNSDGA
ncbi:hypothetical protein [Amycolatopsis japonica]|uniref:hypothetical protein n=1 Tax=Amycolatopsis japonica TaxID=208439 RepID=UPI003827440F